MEPDDIVHLIFFKEIQIIFIDLPDTFNDFIKDSSIGDEGGCNYCFNSNRFDDYFFHKIVVDITISCKRISKDKCLVTTPIEKNLEDMVTIISMNNLRS